MSRTIIEWELDDVELADEAVDLVAFRSSPLLVSRGSIYDQIIETSLMDDQDHYDENNYIYSLCLCESAVAAAFPDMGECRLPLFEHSGCELDEMQPSGFDYPFRISVEMLQPIPNH